MGDESGSRESPVWLGSRLKIVYGHCLISDQFLRSPDPGVTSSGVGMLTLKAEPTPSVTAHIRVVSCLSTNISERRGLTLSKGRGSRRSVIRSPAPRVGGGSALQTSSCLN